MIKVLIKKSNDRFESLEVKGHAGAGPEGHDIVCAGVSAVTVGGLNNLERPDDFQIEISEGYVYAKALKDVTLHDQVVLETIVTGLLSIQETYGDFIKIQNL